MTASTRSHGDAEITESAGPPNPRPSPWTSANSVRSALIIRLRPNGVRPTTVPPRLPASIIPSFRRTACAEIQQARRQPSWLSERCGHCGRRRCSDRHSRSGECGRADAACRWGPTQYPCAAANDDAARARCGCGASTGRRERAGRGAARVGPDGAGAEGSRHRIRRRESRIELRGHSGIDHQLRQSAERDAGVHHRAARGVGGDDGAWLREGDRQADVRAAARDDRHPARRDVDLPGLLRQDAGAAHRRARSRLHRRAQRERHGRHGAQLHEVGRDAEDARGITGRDSARLQRSDHAALRSDDGGDRYRACRRKKPGR